MAFEEDKHIASAPLSDDALERFAAILDHPERFSDAEIDAFFSEPDHRQLYRLYRLSQKAELRGKMPAADADRAWEQFRTTTIAPENDARRVGRARRMTLYIAALAAAASLLLLFTLRHGSDAATAIEGSDAGNIVALKYDNRPQQVTLQGDDSPSEVVSQKDSISFLAAAAPVSTTTTALQRTLSTPRGVDFKVTLPDGTEVWLNAESSLQFPTAFTGKTREVIVKGEAYFKVAHNADVPFIVKAHDMDIRVTGTEFDVQAYNPVQPRVALVNGTVVVKGKDAQPVTLKPGQGAQVMEDGQLTIKEVDTYAATQWVDGYFYFQDEPLVEIMQELGRWYNLTVQFTRAEKMQTKLHFSAERSASIKDVLERINEFKGVKATLKGRSIVVE